jgi:hypothetical protein
MAGRLAETGLPDDAHLRGATAITEVAGQIRDAVSLGRHAKKAHVIEALRQVAACASQHALVVVEAEHGEGARKSF